MKNIYIQGKRAVLVATLTGLCSVSALAKNVTDAVVSEQRKALQASTDGKGYGPQSPRDIDQAYGTNMRAFGFAPNRSQMNLCNIHFHQNAEHKGGDYTTYAGNGDGKGHDTGYVYDGKLTKAQLKPANAKICGSKDMPLQAGDTIEVHWVFSSAQITPGPTLGACLADSTMNPGLRVEGQVFVLANDESALNFGKLAEVAMVNGYAQAPNIPGDTGRPVEYLGSTTGPAYNEKASPLQVSWSMRPQTAVLDINSVGEWCNDNIFDEGSAHAVRNLVTNPALLSPIR